MFLKFEYGLENYFDKFEQRLIVKDVPLNTNAHIKALDGQVSPTVFNRGAYNSSS